MLTQLRFARRALSIATEGSSWARDILFPEGATSEPARREPVERFLKEMRGRLDALEKELNE